MNYGRPSTPGAMDAQANSTSQDQPSFPSILNSLFRRLPGDIERFHQLAEELKANETVSFKPLRDIKIIDCVQDRNIPFFGRAFLSGDNRIFMCGNTTWKMFLRNDRRGLQNLLLHEMIHFYDRKVRNFNFSTAPDLACSEIRAYDMSSTCDGSSICVFRKTEGSMSMSQATQYMPKEERTAVIAGLIHRCMADKMPFERPENPTNALPPSQDPRYTMKTTTPTAQPTYPSETPSSSTKPSTPKSK